MGLDIVELVMRTEETFAIEIPDDEAEQIRTVGDLYRTVLIHLDIPYQPAQPDPFFHPQPKFLPRTEPWTASQVWSAVRHVVIDQLQVDPDDVYPEANFQSDLGAD
jgi:acyl carrier protein